MRAELAKVQTSLSQISYLFPARADIAHDHIADHQKESSKAELASFATKVSFQLMHFDFA